jgi:hypothetical protein
VQERKVIKHVSDDDRFVDDSVPYRFTSRRQVVIMCVRALSIRPGADRWV